MLLQAAVGNRCGLNPVLLWLWCRPAAVAPVPLLAQELQYATGAALKRKKKKEMNNAFDGLISRWNTAEERISELEDFPVESQKIKNNTKTETNKIRTQYPRISG